MTSTQPTNLCLPGILAVALIASSPCLALAAGLSGGDSDWIVSASTMGTLDFQSNSGSSLSVFSLGAGVGHSIGASFELIALVTFFSASSSGFTSSDTEIDGQLNYVVTGNHANAFYLGGRVGDSISSGGGASASSTVFAGVAGKRFQLIGPVTYDPNFSVIFTNNAAGMSAPDFHIVPLQFTLVF